MRPPLQKNFDSNGHVPHLQVPNMSWEGNGGGVWYGNKAARKYVEMQKQSPLEIGCVARGHQQQTRPLQAVGEDAIGSVMSGFRHEVPRVYDLESGALAPLPRPCANPISWGKPIITTFTP